MRTYIVKPGDGLGRIAGRTIGDSRYQDVALYLRAIVALNPTILIPGWAVPQPPDWTALPWGAVLRLPT